MVKNLRLLITGVDTAVVKMLPNIFHPIFLLQSKGIFLVVDAGASGALMAGLRNSIVLKYLVSVGK